ncbi:TPA: hypothetical protein UNK10_000350 [Stenotrophomonas maltophilia]|uniref:hypothetical protein n=1 Tax=Stenotrophomonas maltophilia TaxID=40324 RepID=UPI00117D162F|nr:hypothetical protein [Stenotrophomonas maltophilia]MCU1209932.1 hypothetical protein [Stenotrophomonas maltophilia]HEL5613981.1 hypothetical protein [Stenotrophomonas maltophilia]
MKTVTSKASAAIDAINAAKRQYMKIGDRQLVVDFARACISRQHLDPMMNEQLQRFDRLEWPGKYYEAAELMMLWVPQLDDRLVPSVMDDVRFKVEQEMEMQRKVFDAVIGHFKATGETLSGVGVHALRGRWNP